jgi:hypothetical protein
LILLDCAFLPAKSRRHPGGNSQKILFQPVSGEMHVRSPRVYRSSQVSQREWNVTCHRCVILLVRSLIAQLLIEDPVLKGHDFSRVAKTSGINRALAPEGAGGFNPLKTEQIDEAFWPEPFNLTGICAKLSEEEASCFAADAVWH